MAILVYKDDACTLQISAPQKFTRSSTIAPYTSFTLAEMSSSTLAHLYVYNGTSHIKLVQGVDYSITGSVITLATALGATNVLIAVPTNRLNLNFGGVFGATKTTSTSIVLKREDLYMYDTLLLASEDLDTTPYAQTFIDTSFNFTPNQSMINSASEAVTGSKCTSAVSGQLTGLTINALEGYALVLNNAYIGIIIANDVDSILVNNVGYTHVGTSNDDISIFSVGSLLFALDINGTIPDNSAFAPVLALPNLEPGNDTVKVWVKDTVVIPETATNYPNMAFKLTGIEYLA